MSLKYVFFLYVTYITVTYSKPIQNQQNPSDLLDYLQNFGYLPAAADDGQALLTESSVREAISNLQRFGGITITGEIDESTLKLLEASRCGNKDIIPKDGNSARQKRFVIGSKGWNKRSIKYHLTNWTPKLESRENVMQELRRAFESWEPYSGLKFIETEDYNQADIRILFGRYSHGDWYPFDGTGHVLAHAYYPYEYDQLGGDIHFDEDEYWSINGTETSVTDFFTVAVHEIGHSLGLAHSPMQESIMYPFYKGMETSFALGYDDILAVYQQYISASFSDSEDEIKDNESKDYVDDYIEFPTDDSPKQPFPDDYQADEGDYYEFDKDLSTTKSTVTRPTTTTSKTTSIYLTSTTLTTTTLITTTETTRAKVTTGISTTSSDSEISSKTSTTLETTRSYEGDYEDLDDYIERHKAMKVADLCSISCDNPRDYYDTISVIRGEIFVFKGRQMWRFSERGRLRQGYPAPIHQMFNVPARFSRIDAVIESPQGFVFFFGNRFSIISSNFDTGFNPTWSPLSDLGLPDAITQVDAAFIWPKNGKLYIFSGGLYWRYSADLIMEEGYPQSLERWKKVPQDFKSVIAWKDGLTYFFGSGQNSWRFNDYDVRLEKDWPIEIKHYWFGCQKCNN